MKRNNSHAALILGIEAVTSKYRASLTVKEIEMLEDVKRLLHEMDQKGQKQEKQMLILSVLFKFSTFLLNPEVFEKIKHLIRQLL